MSGSASRFPLKINEAFQAFWRTQTLTTALRFNLFTVMDLAPMAHSTLAAKLGCSLRGTLALLDGLIAIGLVDRDEKGLFRLTEESAQFLVEGKPDYLGANRLAMNENQFEQWVLLDEAVQTGSPVISDLSEDPGRLATLLNGIRVESRLVGKQMAEFVDIARGYPDGLEVLDVGGGSGVIGTLFAQANKKAHITQIDRPEANKIAKKTAETAGVVQNYQFIDGNYHEIGFGESYYDVVVMSNICHIESIEGNQSLFKRIHAALVNDGMLIISDFVIGDPPTASAGALLFGLNMLLHTPTGGAYTETQYREWLVKAGFDSVEVHEIGSPSKLVIAEK